MIVNGENTANGAGITSKIALKLLGSGVDVLTTGNHVWRQREVYQFLAADERIVRPANYPEGAPGRGLTVRPAADGTPVAVIDLAGDLYMEHRPLGLPRRRSSGRRGVGQAETIVVDIHAEATSEKVALGHYLDGRVTVVVGTHTHVQTSDGRVLPGGTAYITDVGMTGPLESVIGVRTDIIIRRFPTELPQCFRCGRRPVRLNAGAGDGRRSAGDRNRDHRGDPLDTSSRVPSTSPRVILPRLRIPDRCEEDATDPAEEDSTGASAQYQGSLEDDPPLLRAAGPQGVECARLRGPLRNAPLACDRTQRGQQSLEQQNDPCGAARASRRRACLGGARPQALRVLATLGADLVGARSRRVRRAWAADAFDDVALVGRLLGPFSEEVHGGFWGCWSASSPTGSSCSTSSGNTVSPAAASGDRPPWRHWMAPPP